jgi:transposase-like protein
MADYVPVPCPQCGSVKTEKVAFSLWGGALGPRLLSHAKCLDCKATFNGKTGQSNNRAIALYMVVTGLIAFAIIFAISVARG